MSMQLSFAISHQQSSFGAVVQGDFHACLNLMSRLGYGGVEIALRDPAALSAGELGGMLREAGLRLAALGTGQAYLDEGLSLSHPDPAIQAKARQRLERHVELAQEHGALVIIGLIRGRVRDHGDRAACLDRLAGNLARVAATAQSHGVRLAIEPINRYECDIFNRVDEVLGFIERLAEPALCVLADSFHMNIEEPNLIQALLGAGDRLGHVHLADSNRFYPGRGHLDFPAMLKALDAMSYNGFLSGEMIPDPDAATAITRYHDQVSAWLRQL